MQYYVYNNLNSQNEYQKVFVDGILAANREIAIGKELFEIFTTFSSEPPIGALPLNGYEITECNSKLPEFWTLCVKRKTNHTIPCVSGLDVYNQISEAQNGNCGYFYIQDDNNKSDYGTVKLPCLNTAVLANIKLLKEVHGIILTSGDIISNSNELGAYYPGNNISHNHTGTTSDSHFNAGSGTNPYAAGGPPQLGISNGFFAIVADTKKVTIMLSGLSLANPAHIKVYYWIQVFSSYITQDLDGKLLITTNNTSGLIGTVDSIIESKFSNIINNLLPTISSSIAALISANILNNLRELLGLVQNIPLTFTAAASEVKLQLVDQTNSNVLQYRRNFTAVWLPYDGSVITLENLGDYVQFQNTDKEWLNTYKYEYNELFKLIEKSSNKKYKASGNIQSLLNYIDYTIPRCYLYMFLNCSNLTEAPELPATTLTEYCYSNMFHSCTNLTEVPELPATTLANGCYSGMFSNCSNLTEAPELPATTLTEYCYSNMFNSCSSLTEAPALPATTLANGCYSNMFSNCSNLTEASALPATTLTDGCYSGMFQSCTSLTTAPELPATTLANGCYSGMFSSCSSLTEAPALPATTLIDGCYYMMFSSCSNLIVAPALPATTLAKDCYWYMFSNCSSLTEAPALPATTLAERCYNSMFQSCTSLTTAPELPATTLADSCYSYMFDGCTNLTVALELPATILVNGCYMYMFRSCTKLSSIRVKFTSWLGTGMGMYTLTSNWVNGVSSTGTFTCPAALPQLFGVSRIPDGWTVQTI